VEVQHWARRDKTNWYRIQAKCVDFVLCEAHDFAPRLVIELDDRSHDRPDRRERDAFVDEVLASAGIPILHARWQRHYDTQSLAQRIADTLGIAAPVPAQLPMPVASTISPQPVQFWTPIAVDPDRAAVAAPMVACAPIAPMRRVCGQCQAELREQAKFCSQCGAVFSIVS
jgi:hypothetical protein